MSFLYASVPVGFALLALRYLLELIGMQNRKSVTATDAWG
jgi:TRAP-type C4-dicarboxylate transport system permease small subunit